MRSLCTKHASELLKYEEAVTAVVRLPNRRKITIFVSNHEASIHQTHGFIDLLTRIQSLGFWNLDPLCEELHGRLLPPTRLAIKAATLDALIEQIATCDSVPDVASKYAIGALDPFELIHNHFEVATRASA